MFNEENCGKLDNDDDDHDTDDDVDEDEGGPRQGNPQRHPAHN